MADVVALKARKKDIELDTQVLKESKKLVNASMAVDAYPFDADDIAGQFATEDESGDVNLIQQDERFTDERFATVKPQYNFEDLVNFIGDRRAAEFALKYGMQAISAGATIPAHVQTAIALSKAPELGGVSKTRKQVQDKGR